MIYSQEKELLCSKRTHHSTELLDHTAKVLQAEQLLTQEGGCFGYKQLVSMYFVFSPHSYRSVMF